MIKRKRNTFEPSPCGGFLSFCRITFLSEPKKMAFFYLAQKKNKIYARRSVKNFTVNLVKKFHRLVKKFLQKYTATNGVVTPFIGVLV